jgi:hypothetical protein
VLAVVAVAAVDALREDPKPLPAIVRGELVYSDSDCRRHGVRLPSLGRRDFLTVGCDVFSRGDSLGVLDGNVAWFAFPVPGGSTTLLRREEVPPGLRVVEVAWLGDTRFAAVLAPGGVLTVWDGDQLYRRLGPGYEQVRASPRGQFLAALEDGGYAVFDGGGARLDLPAGHAIAWSPDDRFVAVALADEIVLLRAEGGEPLARLSVRARDLDWRRED